MKILLSLWMMLLPCVTFAGTGCQVINYPDHDEAVCVGDSEQTSASPQITLHDQVPGHELTVASAQSAGSEQQNIDVPPEMIVRNDLARLHAAVWLNRRPGQ
jgi:hypothetical protein